MIPLNDLLADLDREQLVALLLRLVERDPALAGAIEAVRSGQAVEAPSGVADPVPPPEPSVDIDCHATVWTTSFMWGRLLRSKGGTIRRCTLRCVAPGCRFASVGSNISPCEAQSQWVSA